MARKKQQERIFDLLKKPELWIGVFTIGVLLGIGGGLAVRYNLIPKISKISKNIKVLSPVPESKTTTPTPPKKQEVLKKITKLADTASVFSYEVKKNDSYWTISKRVCRTGKYFLSIQEKNYSQALHPGDMVQVVCE